MLLTVSPVPFKATFSGEDALIANTYSKAVQRAAAYAFSAAHDDVDYFPSYEIVTLSRRDVAFESDNLHVTAGVVRRIMRQVVSAYAPDVPLPDLEDAVVTRGAIGSGKSYLDAFKQGKHLAAEGELRAAADRFEDVIQNYSAQLKPDVAIDVRTRLAAVLAKCGEHARASEHLLELRSIRPNDADIRFRLGHSYMRQGMTEDARAQFESALELDPSHEPATRILARLNGAP